jgi:thiol-disulfide isomerase/thioredoxin
MRVGGAIERFCLATGIVLLSLAAIRSASLAATEASEAPEARQSTLSERIVDREVAAAHPPLDDPEAWSANDAEAMRDEDVVVGLLLNGEARAYPWWVLKNFHAVNDTFAGRKVLVAFCEQCSAATAFDRRLDERELSMETEGVVSGTIILRDRQTGTLWAPFDGKGLEGPLVGRRLERFPVFLTTWKDWRLRHPATDVVVAEAAQRGGHGSRESPGRWGIVGSMGETMLGWDTRLAENEMVFGAIEGEQTRAYPIRVLAAHQGVVNDDLFGRPVVAATRGEFEVVVYDRRVDGKRLTFEPSGDPLHPLRDLETGSAWTIEGEAVSGQAKGKRLTPIDGYAVEWHVWAEYHPAAELFGDIRGDSAAGFSFPVRSLPRLQGERVAVAPLALKSEINVVALWARWCPPCREKVPLFQRLAEGASAGTYTFQTLVVQLPDQTELGELKRFLFERSISWPIYLFDDASYSRLDRTYREVAGRGLVIPMAFLVDKSGEVLEVLEGAEVGNLEAVLLEYIDAEALPTSSPFPSGNSEVGNAGSRPSYRPVPKES